MNKVYIIGTGPGAVDYVTPAAQREIERSDCLIGAPRLLSLFNGLKKEEVSLDGNFGEAVKYIKENREKKRIAVLVTGDPGLYSLMKMISKVLKRDEYDVIPGISSVQLAFARIGDSWEDAKIVSLHGRGMENLAQEAKGCGKLFLFTDPAVPPDKIAACLLENGVDNRNAYVFEQLSYPDERMIETDLNNLSNMKGFGLCVMIVKK